MAEGKRESERGNEGGSNQGLRWRLQTRLWKTPENRKKKRDSQRGRGVKAIECSVVKSHLRGYKSCTEIQTLQKARNRILPTQPIHLLV